MVGVPDSRINSCINNANGSDRCSPSLSSSSYYIGAVVVPSAAFGNHVAVPAYGPKYYSNRAPDVGNTCGGNWDGHHFSSYSYGRNGNYGGRDTSIHIEARRTTIGCVQA